MAGEVIPTVFDQPGACFVFMGAGKKFPPIEKEWQTKGHSFQEANTHASNGGNVGAMAGNGYIGLDQDDPKAFAGLTLPNTTTWETRSGRLGMWLKCGDRTPELLAKYGFKADQAQIKLFDSKQKDCDFQFNTIYKPAGEIKLERTYQVIPPSWKLVDGQRTDYKLRQDIPPAEVSLEWLLSELQRIGIVFSQRPKSIEEEMEELIERNADKPKPSGDWIESMGKVAADDPRQRKYVEAAVAGEVEKVRSAPEGDRNNQLNKSAYALGQLVGAGVLSKSEAVRALESVAEDGEPEKIPRTIESGIEAGTQDPRSIPEPEAHKAEEKPAGPTVLDAFRVLLKNEADAEKDTKFDKWTWRLNKPRVKRALETGSLTFEAEEKAHKFLGKYKDTLNKYGIDYSNLYPIPRKPKINKEEFPEEIKATALDILKNGDPLQYIADSCSQMVLGAEKAFRKLTCCVSVQNVKQSAGLHPKFSGESSGGKTYTAYTFAHHLPCEAVIKGSMSNKSGFYHKDGNRVLRILDDYQAGNEDLDTIIKQTSSEFHEPYIHRTVVNQKAATLSISSEQTWLITSVDSSQDVQVLNRQLPINVDDSIDLTKKVNNRTIERYGKGEEQRPISEEVLVCRAIFQILRDAGYINVRVPFWDRIEWLDVSNRRNPSIFMDLVIAHTAIFCFQRQKDNEGYYLATEEDYNAAKALFTDRDGEELVKRLTAREKDTLELLVSNPGGLTRDEIAEKLHIAPQRVSQILGGQKGAGGLMQKVQIRETKRSDMLRINEEESRTVHKTIYALKDYDRFSGFDAVVRLKPAPEESRKRGKHDESIDESKQNESCRDNESKESKNKNKKEEGAFSRSPSGKLSSSHENGEKAFVAFVEATDSEEKAFAELSTALPGKPIKCAVCGEDLTGKGQLMKGGKAYCPKPGCGYPARDTEAST